MCVQCVNVMQPARSRLFSPKWNSELLYYSTRGYLKLSFDLLFMFLGQTNPNLWVSGNAIVHDLSKLTDMI